MGIHDGHREKMRSRFLSGGLEQFADHEALELLLYYAIPRRDTNPIAHVLMDRYGSLSAVLAAPVEDLQKVEGIGESAAILLKLVPRLCAKARLADADRQELILNTASRAGAYLLERFYGEQNEVIYQLCLDRKGKLMACKRLGEGSIASAAQLGKLGRYVEKLLHQIAEEVRQGNIDADPCCHSEDDSFCQYCDWADACHFQDGRDGDHLHYILPVKAEEFWASLEESEGGET